MNIQPLFVHFSSDTTPCMLHVPTRILIRWSRRANPYKRVPYKKALFRTPNGLSRASAVQKDVVLYGKCCADASQCCTDANHRAFCANIRYLRRQTKPVSSAHTIEFAAERLHLRRTRQPAICLRKSMSRSRRCSRSAARRFIRAGRCIIRKVFPAVDE